MQQLGKTHSDQAVPGGKSVGKDELYSLKSLYVTRVCLSLLYLHSQYESELVMIAPTVMATST